MVTWASMISLEPSLRELPVVSIDPAARVFEPVVFWISLICPAPLNSDPAEISVPKASIEPIPRAESFLSVEAWLVVISEANWVPVMS